MCEIVIFGGTTEGRRLAEYCVDRGIDTVVCVVSEYGQLVLPKGPRLQVRTGPMETDQMCELLRTENPQMVLDATHPYARVVTGCVMDACEKTSVPYLRITRQETTLQDTDHGSVEWVESVSHAVERLQHTTGSVLVTTGSRELQAYRELSDYKNRLFVRVLPDEAAMAQCRNAELGGTQIIAMQGPFTTEMNAALIRHTGARYLVTKEGGAAGGFREKMDAALECGVDVIVIGRPEKPEGISVEEGIRRLSLIQVDSGRRKVSLIGIGMGSIGQLTVESLERLQESDVFLGAERILDSLGGTFPDTRKEPYYKSDEVLAWMESHPGYQRIAVLYSGDTGFYSGAKRMIETLAKPEQETKYETTVYPGISSVSYLCGKVQESWEDAYLGSRHGREADVVELLQHHKKLFLLLGGENSAGKLCQNLAEHGYGDVLVSVGERLSYPDERVTTKPARELAEQTFDPLAAVLIRNEAEDER